MDASDFIPTAEVVLIKGDQVNQWRAICCPYCGKSHFHGAGSPQADPLSYLGHSGSHCVDQPPNRGYELVLAQENGPHGRDEDPQTRPQRRRSG